MSVHYGGRGLGHMSRSMGGATPAQHTDGLISEWLFAEGSGTTVNDEVGSNDINLNTPTTPNYTWNSRGIALANGLIQTPSITGARTVAFLYKTKRDSNAGFMSSGGSASGSGLLQDSGVNENYWIGGGYGVHPALNRKSIDSGSSTISMFELNRGGYVLVFRDMGTTYNTILGFGGRHSTTTDRCDEFEIVWAGVWGDTLTDAERTKVYNRVAWISKQRSVYLKASDAPSYVRAVMIGGESTAEGLSLISALSGGDQAQTFSKVYTTTSNATGAGVDMTAPALFDLGVNQQITTPATVFGPELGFAQQIELGSETVYITKCALGSTFVAPANSNGINNPTAQRSWSAAELPIAGLLWSFMSNFYTADQQARLGGVGLNYQGIQFLIGLNDALNTAYTTDAATYTTRLNATFNGIKTYSGLSSLPIHMPRAHDSDPSSNATALGHVRTGQADFASGWAEGCELYDTDALGLNGDSVHFNAAASLTIGEQGYNYLLG